VGNWKATQPDSEKPDTERRGKKRKLDTESRLEQDGESVDDLEIDSDNSFSSNNDTYVEHKVCMYFATLKLGGIFLLLIFYPLLLYV